jgi:hypothetical protein
LRSAECAEVRASPVAFAWGVADDTARDNTLAAAETRLPGATEIVSWQDNTARTHGDIDFSGAMTFRRWLARQGIETTQPIDGRSSSRRIAARQAPAVRTRWTPDRPERSGPTNAGRVRGRCRHPYRVSVVLNDDRPRADGDPRNAFLDDRVH